MRTYEIAKPIPDDRLQQLFRSLLKQFSTGAPNPRPYSTEVEGRREQDHYPLTATSVYGSPQSGFRKTMAATTDPATESYLTSLRYETYGLRDGIKVEYEFTGKAPWTDPEAEAGSGRLIVTGDSSGLEELVTTSVGGHLGA